MMPAEETHRETLPDFFYKYRVWDDNAKHIITHHQLWFSDPFSLNDPFEKELSVDADKLYEKIPEILSNKRGLTREQRRKTIRLINPKNKQLYAKILKERILKGWVSCSFSKQGDSQIMWAHYADSSKGICLVFNWRKDLNAFMAPLTVKYSAEKYVWDGDLTEAERAQDLLARKSDVWAYEHEIRVVKNIPSRYTNTSRNYDFKTEALSEIIFGVNASQQTIDEVKDLCAKSGFNTVRFTKLNLRNNKYEFDKIEI